MDQLWHQLHCISANIIDIYCCKYLNADNSPLNESSTKLPPASPTHFGWTNNYLLILHGVIVPAKVKTGAYLKPSVSLSHNNISSCKYLEIFDNWDIPILCSPFSLAQTIKPIHLFCSSPLLHYSLRSYYRQLEQFVSWQISSHYRCYQLSLTVYYSMGCEYHANWTDQGLHMRFHQTHLLQEQ